MNSLYKIWKYFTDYLFPSKCLQCFVYTQEYGLCNKCFSDLNFNSKPYCQICGKGFALEIEWASLCAVCLVKKPHYDMARFIIKYDEKSKSITIK
jgi:predicted amidophosphoribosyltransferase